MNYELFPTLIRVISIPQTEETFLKFIEKATHLEQTLDHSTDWRCDTFNTLNKYDMIADPLFQNLTQQITSEVKLLAKDFGVTKDVRVKDSWINVARPGAFQETHIHPNSHFSVAYYIKAPVNSGNIVFRSAEANTDMFELPVSELTPANYKTFFIEPEVGKLIVFRSNLLHMVEKNMSNETRISITMNFVVE